MLTNTSALLLILSVFAFACGKEEQAKTEAARSAYNNALNDDKIGSQQRNWLTIKLNELGKKSHAEGVIEAANIVPDVALSQDAMNNEQLKVKN